MLSKINPASIISEHIRTLKSNDSGKISWSDIVLFYVLPIATAVPLATFYIPNEALSNILITSLSLFAALLFNLLLLSLDTIRKEKESVNMRERVLLLMKETYFNIAYAILVSLVTVSVLLLPYLCKDGFRSSLQCFVWIVVYSLIGNFILTMAMILKRMQVILTTLLD